MVHSELGAWSIVCLPHFKLVIKCQLFCCPPIGGAGALKVKGLLPIRIRQPARALQTVRGCVRSYGVITQPGWASTSVTDYAYASRQPLSHHACSSRAYGSCKKHHLLCNSFHPLFTSCGSCNRPDSLMLYPWQITICCIYRILEFLKSSFGLAGQTELNF
jgi:hypothetical protein